MSSVPIALRWGDQDAYGHINNVAIVRILEEARARGVWAESAGVLPALRADERVWSLVTDLQVTYRRPLEYGEDVDVRLDIERIGGASFVIRYAVLQHGAEEVSVEARTTIALVDSETNRPVRLNPAQREFLGALRG